MHPYRTHLCHELRPNHSGQTVRLSGWIARKRDHGDLVFVDLRDHYGITQCVAEVSASFFSHLESARLESVVTVTGVVKKRDPETINPKMPTGDIEVVIGDFHMESAADPLPFPIAQEAPYAEDLRLKYRFLDLRRSQNHEILLLRAAVIGFLRQQMTAQGFVEIQTPILTASSPEGARDFLVPSRLHPGKFYALPQAPQQFKQLLMMAGLDRYFQIAPCFRDEDSRRDRSPGEFYQLDFEMAYVTQEEVFAAIEPVLESCFRKFTTKAVSKAPFIHIPYRKALERYGSDKPDLRNPLILKDVTEAFAQGSFGLFAKLIEKGAWVKALKAPDSAGAPRSFFDKLNEWAKEEAQGGLGYILFDSDGTPKGPIAQNLEKERIARIKETVAAKDGDSVFFVCGMKEDALLFAGRARDKICDRLDLLEKEAFRFCWITDFPLYERNAETGKIDFSHNPFSMPQGGLLALQTKDPLEVLAHQYDIVCNGVELSSGAIRNHRPDIMKKAFEIAGYDETVLKEKFAALYNAFHYGAPPHGGAAPGIDRIVMLLADKENVRDVIAFPMNQRAEDLMMGAPAQVDEKTLGALGLKIAPPSKASQKP